MGWAARLIERLQKGETVTFRPRGNSMGKIIKSGDLVVVEPLQDTEPITDDVVLCQVASNDYLHRVVATDSNRFQIGNAHGRINGWITIRQIHGICVSVNECKMPAARRRKNRKNP